MFGASVSLIVEVLLAVLLAPTLVFCITLERRLRGLRQDQKSLVETVGALNAGITAAQASLTALRSAARDADATLGTKVQSARLLADELQLLNASCERIASRMEVAREPVAKVLRPAQPALGDALRAVR